MKIDVLQSDIPMVAQVVATCQTYNIKHIVISPGSRNAPLAISFSNHPYFKCYSIVDERCAGFFAMGIAQQLNKPVALVCTSGSALLNYYPAIAEAYYSQIPLVVLSADRPKEFIDIGDGQTIRQSKVYENHIAAQADLYNANTYTAVVKNNNEKLLNEVLQSCLKTKLPIHVNIPLYEPLYNTVKVTVEDQFSAGFSYEKHLFSLSKEEISIWENAEKILVVVGVLPPNSVQEKLLKKLLDFPSVLVLTETTSNLHHPNIIPGIDKLIAAFNENEKEAFQPDLLLSFGGMIVSKKIKALLRNFQPQTHWHIDELRAYDTYLCLTKHFKTSINKFIEQLPVVSSSYSNYQQSWLKTFNELRKGHKNYLKDIPYSDLKVFGEIFNRLESNICLQLSNSSTIRYSQLFDISSKLEVFCNRGTSGIDGSTSTAIGAATVVNKPTILITGDLSFLYDSNALWNNYIPENFKIIIINNNGGGIFRILPGDKSASYFEEFLETKHQHTAKYLAEMYDFSYLSANENDLFENLDQFMSRSNKIILEIFTPNEINDIVLLEYFTEIRKFISN